MVTMLHSIPEVLYMGFSLHLAPMCTCKSNLSA